MSAPRPAQAGICPACGHIRHSHAPYPVRKRPSDGLNFEAILICTNCGLGQACPIPTRQQLDAFYRSGAYWHATGNHPSQQAHENVQAMLRVNRCLPHLPRSEAHRVLDVGAGHGCIADWLARLQRRGVASYSFVEPDRQHAEHIGRKRPGFAVHAREELPRDSAYDLIFLNHVLEHVADPREFMRSVTQLLMPGGIAYIETPHLDFRFKDDVFPHTFFFTPAAFEALALDLPRRDYSLRIVRRMARPRRRDQRRGASMARTSVCDRCENPMDCSADMGGPGDLAL